MRILFVHDYKQIDGGAGQVLADEIALLKKNKHQVYLFTFSGSHYFGNNNRYPLNKRNIFIYKEPKDPSISAFLQKYFSIRLYRSFKETIRKIKPDIVHIHEIRKGTSSIILAAKHSHIPVIHTIHDIHLACMSEFGMNRKTGHLCLKGSVLNCLINGCVSVSKIVRHGLLWKINQWINKHYVNRLICPSRFLLKTLSGLNYKNISILSNFSSLENTGYKNIIKNQILYVGRLVELKGIIYLVKAFGIVVKKYPRIKLKLIGNGPEKNNLKTYVKQNRINNVRFLDTIPHSKLGRYYRQSIVFVLPSIGIENSPLSIIEAISFGIPVIASNVGGIIELVNNNQNGYLVKQKNDFQLAEKIMRILEYPNQLAEMQQYSQDFYKQKFHPDIHYRLLISLYNSVI